MYFSVLYFCRAEGTQDILSEKPILIYSMLVLVGKRGDFECDQLNKCTTVISPL